MKLECIYRELDYTVVQYSDDFTKSRNVPITIINQLCIENLSTYEGRRVAIKKKFNIKTMTPIYVNDEVLLFPIKGVKEYENVWVNYHEIRSVNDGFIVLNSGKTVYCEPSVIKRQLKNCFEIAF